MVTIDNKKHLGKINKCLFYFNYALLWGKKNNRLLLLISIIATIMLGITISMQIYHSYRNSAAAEALDAIFPYYQKVLLTDQYNLEQVKAVRKGLEQLIRNFETTPSGWQAYLALINLLVQLGEYNDAISQNSIKINNDTNLPSLLLPLILKNKGQALENANKFKEAAKFYAAAAKASGSALAYSLMLDQARVTEAAGDIKNAIELYHNLNKENQCDNLPLTVKLHLAQLGILLDCCTSTSLIPSD